MRLLQIALAFCLLAPSVLAVHQSSVALPPVSCVNGAWTLPTGVSVTGNGSPASPYVLAGAELNASEHWQSRDLILLEDCGEVEIHDSQLYAWITRVPWSAQRAPLDRDVVEVGIHVRGCTNAWVNNTIVKLTRHAGVLAEGPCASVNVSHSDIKANFGNGIEARDGASLDVWSVYAPLNGFVTNEVYRGNAAVRVESGARARVEWSNLSYTCISVLANKTTWETSATLNGNDVGGTNSFAVLNKNLTIDSTLYVDTTCGGQSNVPWWSFYGNDLNGRESLQDPVRPTPTNGAHIASPENDGASHTPSERQHATESLPALPSLREWPSYVSDARVINSRFNYYGSAVGPRGSLDGSGVLPDGGAVSTLVDAAYWLSIPPPQTLVAGVAKGAAPGADRVLLGAVPDGTPRPGFGAVNALFEAGRL